MSEEQPVWSCAPAGFGSHALRVRVKRFGLVRESIYRFNNPEDICDKIMFAQKNLADWIKRNTK